MFLELSFGRSHGEANHDLLHAGVFLFNLLDVFNGRFGVPGEPGFLVQRLAEIDTRCDVSSYAAGANLFHLLIGVPQHAQRRGEFDVFFKQRFQGLLGFFHSVIQVCPQANTQVSAQGQVAAIFGVGLLELVHVLVHIVGVGPQN